MRTPEVIVSNVCGHAREVRVSGDNDRRQARNMRCNDCRLEEKEPYETVTIMMPCPWCKQERAVRPDTRWRLGVARKRICKRCVFKRNLALNSLVDH